MKSERKKVLIISPNFFGYHISVSNAFRSFGYDTKIETHDDPIHPFRGLLKWRHKLSLNKEQFQENNRLKYKKHIEIIFDEYNPDIVFIFNGTILKDSTLEYFRKKGAKVILWMYDSVLSHNRKTCIPHIDHVDLFCCFEKKDVEYFDKENKKAHFLPLACDTSVYHPINNSKDIDIFFAGTIYISKKRIKLLRALVEHYPEKKILIYGHYKPFYKNPLKWLFREKKEIFKNTNISPTEVTQILSRTKVALNIHNEQSLYGANPRVFEVSGANAYQICDTNSYIKGLFKNGEVGLYETEEELFALIDYALEHDMSAHAQAAHDIVIAEHTFEKRVKQMLDWLGELSS